MVKVIAHGDGVILIAFLSNRYLTLVPKKVLPNLELHDVVFPQPGHDSYQDNRSGMLHDFSEQLERLLLVAQRVGVLDFVFGPFNLTDRVSALSLLSIWRFFDIFTLSSSTSRRQIYPYRPGKFKLRKL